MSGPATNGTGAEPPFPEVAGVDGCRGRWLVVRRRPGQGARADLVDDLGPVVAQLRRGRLAAMAVDMPIGLLDHHPRQCDVEARALLGPRRSSVFPAPVRAVLGSADYGEARRRSRAAIDLALSRQAFNLLPAIEHLDRLVTTADQDRLVEAHPELAFARLAGGSHREATPVPLAEPKRTADGRSARRALLVAEDPVLADLIDTSPLPPVDLLDAAVLTVTAARVVAGTARRLGTERDHRGRRAEVVW